MLKPLKDTIVCTSDYGSFLEVAIRLSRDVKKVYFCNPSWQHSYPRWNEYMVGSGIEGVERIDTIWPVFDEIDWFVFPDLFQGEFQDWLRSKGKAVFGAGSGEDLELYRDEFYDVMEQSGIDVPERQVVVGLDKLRAKLEKTKDVYIKTNIVRGNLETFHWDEMKLSKPILDELEHSLGIFKNEQTFIINTPIHDSVEYGGDFFCINDRFADRATVGIEIKDACYAAKMISLGDMPAGLRKINKALSPIFGMHGYKGCYSNEVRVTKDKKNYFLDMTARCGQPPTSLQTELITNYSQVLYEIANGLVPEIETKDGNFGVQVIMKSEWAAEEPQPIYFPKKYARFVKIKNLVVQDGVHYYIPTNNIPMKEIGAVSAVGKTLEEAINLCKEICEEVKGFCIKLDCSALDEAMDEVNKLKEFGINLF